MMFEGKDITVSSKGKSIKIHAISIGEVSVKTKFRESEKSGLSAKLDFIFDRNFTPWMPIWVWVIEHPEGIYLIDTGINSNINNPGYFKASGWFAQWINRKMFRFSIEKEQEIDKQLRDIGIKVKSVKTIILTHLHIDHFDGIKYFPEARVLVHKEEWNKPFGDLPELYPSWFKPNLVEHNEEYYHFDAYRLNENMVLINTPGHTHNNISVVLEADDCNFIFAGDVCYSQDQILKDKYAGVNVNMKLAKKTYREIKQFAEIKKTVFLPSHDQDSANRLLKREALY